MLIQQSLELFTQALQRPVTPGGSLTSVGFDLLDVTGNIRVAAGTPLSPDLLQELIANSQPVYRKSHQPPVLLQEDETGVLQLEWISHEGTGYWAKNTPQAEPEPPLPVLLEGAEARPYIQVLQQFNQRLSTGIAPDMAALDLMRNQLMNLLGGNLSQIRMLSQLRVRDGFTFDHTLDVTLFSMALAMKMDYNQQEICDIGLGALLHDLGKFKIPKPIMFKSTRLSEKEFDVMKAHPMLGYKMIVNQLKLPEAIARPALEHQEMHSGGGYPQNIHGQDIHPYSRIVKVADVYDALTSRRPYKNPIASQTALGIMLGEGDKSFDPDCLMAFVELSNYEALS